MGLYPDAMEWTPSACFLDCPDACGLEVQTDAAGQFVRLRGHREHGWSQGVLCAKTSWYGEIVTSEERITEPWMRDRRGRMQPTTWDAALDRIAEQLAPLSGPEILSLEYAGNMGVLGRRFPGRILNALGATRNDGTICDATAEAGFQAVLGRATGFDLEQLESCDAILLWGCDAARTMSHLLPKLKRALQNGARVAAIDIYRSDTIEWLEKHGGEGLVLRPGTDAALALGWAQLAFESRRADLEFLRQNAQGAAEFRAHLQGRYGIEEVCAVTGLDRADFERVAQWFHEAQAPLLKLGIGFCRRKVGGMSMRALGSYAAVLGIADRVHWESGDHFDLDLSELDGVALRPPGCDQPPISLVNLGAELESGRFRASLVWGHNPAVTVPNTRLVRAGLARADHFLVVHELFWTATAQLADVVLPATTFLDQADLLRSYGHRWLHYVPQALEPRGSCRSNLDAFAAIAQRLELPESVWAGSHEDWCLRILERNRARFTESEWERLLAHQPVKLAPAPQPPRENGKASPDWGTRSGRIELHSSELEAAGAGAMAEYVADEGCGGDHEFWFWPTPSKATHNSTYLHSKRHLARLGSPQVHLHPDLAERLGVHEGTWLRVHNDVGSVLLPATLDKSFPPDTLGVSGFWNESEAASVGNVNTLVSSERSDLGGGSCIYSTRVSVEVLPGRPDSPQTA